MINNIFEALKNLRLTVNETEISRLITEDPYAFCKMDSREISERAHVSQATIYRLCDKLEINGLSELKVRITSSLPDYLKKDESFDYNFPFDPNENTESIVHTMQEDYENTIHQVSSTLEYEQLRKAVSMLKNAKAIDVYASSGNLAMAHNFAFQMQEIGVPVIVHEDEYKQRLQSVSSDETHCAILISFGGRGFTAPLVARTLKEKHVPTILIASKEYSDSLGGADAHLYLNNEENHYRKISSFSTRLSLLFLLDLLYVGYFETDYENFIQKKISYYHDMIEVTK